MVTIELTPVDMALAEFIGKMRSETNNDNQIAERLIADLSRSQKCHKDGGYGEVTFSRWSGLYPDTTTHSRKGTVDFVLPDGRSVDVKYSPYPKGRLLVPVDERVPECDLFVLVTGPAPICTLRGWLYRYEHIQEGRIGRVKPHLPLTYISEWNHLRQIDTLKIF